MSEGFDNFCSELRTKINDDDKLTIDLKANSIGASKKAKEGTCPLPSPSKSAGDASGPRQNVEELKESGRVEPARIFSFGPFNLIPAQRLLLEAGKPLRLGSRALDILIALVERRRELVSKEELMAQVWPKVFVEPANLTVHVAALRRVLGDGRNGSRYLVNIPGRGYRFVAPVSVADGEMPH